MCLKYMSINWEVHPIFVVLDIYWRGFSISIHEFIKQVHRNYSEVSGKPIPQLLGVSLVHRLEEKCLHRNFRIAKIYECLDY